MVIIGTEGGLLPVNPARAHGLVMTPAERYDVICDFRRFAGRTLLMTNTSPHGPVSTPAPPLMQVMQITVKHKASSGAPMSVPGPASMPANPKVTELTSLGPPKLSGGSVAPRMITLNKRRGLVFREHHPGHPPDAHPPGDVQGDGPLRLRRPGYAAKYGTADGVPELDVSTLRPFLKSGLIAPDRAEAGLKETVKANPGQVTVVRARFSLPSTALNSAGKLIKPQKYVHHCHIVEHEDNDMMERMIVVP